MTENKKNQNNGNPENEAGRADNNSVDPLASYLEGMGTATARILIDKHVDNDALERLGIKELRNTGRYYIAKIIESDGTLIDEVLIDKQSGKIQSLGRRKK